MILDNAMVFIGSINSAGVPVPALVTALGATTGASAGFNVLDQNPNLGSANIGDAPVGPSINVQIRATLTSAGAATVRFEAVQADDANLTVNVQAVASTDDIPFALLTIGKNVPLGVNRAGARAARRYFGVRIVIGTAVLTNGTGQFLAAAVSDIHDAPVYVKSGFGIA